MGMMTKKRLAGLTERRRSRRYRPPAEFEIVLKRAGLLGWLGANLIEECINASEGGLRAIVAADLREGQDLVVRFPRITGNKPSESRARVEYSVRSGSHPGKWEVGLRFINPPVEVQAWVRTLLRAKGVPLDATTRRLRKDAWGTGR